HLFAAEFTMKREVRPDGTVIDTESVTFTKKTTYRQDWPSYDYAQSIEKDRLQELLFDLCRTVEEPEYSGKGRPPHTVRDSLFAIVFKVYSTFSGRRFSSDLREVHKRGHLS